MLWLHGMCQVNSLGIIVISHVIGDPLIVGQSVLGDGPPQLNFLINITLF